MQIGVHMVDVLMRHVDVHRGTRVNGCNTLYGTYGIQLHLWQETEIQLGVGCRPSCHGLWMFRHLHTHTHTSAYILCVQIGMHPLTFRFLVTFGVVFEWENGR
mmetsp:Transcript_81726/g.144204  ORF Transcript_81726/g.144204 Transcript_81726/m.144204 type:complete len:103 (+) Transcript_81726:2158-2466(+)